MVPADQWECYRPVLHQAREAEVMYALGGAFALAAYTGELRNTKDLDLYIVPESRHEMIAAIERAGFRDLYDRAPYDRAWIYRSARDDVVVDAIWAMANLRALVDDSWLCAGRELVIHGDRVRVVAAEELLWTKLYVLQRTRCDWTDVLNLLDATGAELDWDRLLARLGDDAPLLAGVLSVFAWLSPRQAERVPAEVWERLGLAPPVHARGDLCVQRDRVRERAALLDSRPWFRATRAAC